MNTNRHEILSAIPSNSTGLEFRPDEKGNIRDFANVSQLVCLANLENLNAHFIQEGLSQQERLGRLNQTAIQQMRLLVGDRAVKQLRKKTNEH